MHSLVITVSIIANLIFHIELARLVDFVAYMNSEQQTTILKHLANSRYLRMAMSTNI
jgi:hypothetical protein